MRTPSRGEVERWYGILFRSATRFFRHNPVDWVGR
jgi:hypothetical protein